MPLHFATAAVLLSALAAAPSGQATQPPATCDRACLSMLADQFVHALLANDGSRLPLAKDFRYTENGQALKVGDGLWGTLSAYAGEDPKLAPAAAELAYRVSLADPGSGEIVRLLSISENGTKGVLALRLKIAGDKIGEAEALAVREEFAGARAGTVTLFQPRLLVTMDGAKVGPPDPLLLEQASPPADAGRMIRAANAYFDGIQGDSAKGIPFAEGCIRRDNGVRTTDVADAKPLDPRQPRFRPFALGCAAQIDSGFYRNIGKIRDRRFVADPEHGLLVGLAMVDMPGTELSFSAPGIGKVDYPGPRGMPSVQVASQFEVGDLGAANMISPSTAYTATIFRFVDGKIARIDSFARAGPYGLRSGWPEP